MSAEKVKVMPKGGKIADAILVFPIDAKEILESGFYVLVESEKKSVSKAGADNSQEDEINSMNTKKLNEFIEQNELLIKGFDDLKTLPEKREAVLNALKTQEDL